MSSRKLVDAVAQIGSLRGDRIKNIGMKRLRPSRSQVQHNLLPINARRIIYMSPTLQLALVVFHGQPITHSPDWHVDDVGDFDRSFFCFRPATNRLVFSDACFELTVAASAS